MLMLPAFVGTPELNKVHNVDAMTLLKALPDNYVNCIVTSPPYFGLRDYGVEGQIGLEATPREFIETLVILFREARRILRHDGTLWVNMGDSYANDDKWGGSTSGKHANGLHGNTGIGRTKRHTGFAPKNMLMMPARLAIALQDDGWILRSEIVWHKPNPMPESVADRPTKSHEMVYLLAKSERYYYDAEAIREPSARPGDIQTFGGNKGRNYTPAESDPNFRNGHHQWGRTIEVGENRNKRTVWTVNTEPTPFAHFATFPQKLIEPMILAGCPSTVCACCGAPHERVVEIERDNYKTFNHPVRTGGAMSGGVGKNFPDVTRTDKGFKATCTCSAGTRAGIVLDPFMGSGTTALVARRLNRQYIGSELNIEYAEIARRRLSEAYTPMMQLFMETA